MSKYGTAKYGVNKYGIYDLFTGIPLQNSRFRFATLGRDLAFSQKVVSQTISFPGQFQTCRIRAGEDAPWIRLCQVTVPGTPGLFRLTAHTKDTTRAVLSETAMIRQGSPL